MLSISGVTKRYGKTLANDNISFAVGDGQIGILLGPNGAGKSTIIKCITGLLRFTGRIEINGYENTSLEAKAQLGYIPEMPAVYDLLTVEEHLEFIRRAYKVEDEPTPTSCWSGWSFQTRGTSWARSSPRACSRSSPFAAPCATSPGW